MLFGQVIFNFRDVSHVPRDLNLNNLHSKESYVDLVVIPIGENKQNF